MGSRICYCQKGGTWFGFGAIRHDICCSCLSLEEIVDPTGAGDSFAGGFMGHLASIETNGVIEFRSAVVYGNVMGSFAVEDLV